jgi:prepilin-type N-terminal cleavage/methylation domain-containing protein
MKMQVFRHARTFIGFSLVEVMIAIAVFAFIGIGMMSTVIFMRETAEYDKQRIAAMAAARQFLEEEARRAPYPTLQPVNAVALDNFNTPEAADDLNATVSLQLFQVNVDGSRGAELFAAPSTAQILEVVVTVTWNRTARLSDRQGSVSMSTYKYPDL